MFDWIFKSGSQLHPIEAQTIEAVAIALPENAAALLRQQVSLINKVQRLDHDREVDFYRVEKGRLIFPETALFPNRTEELELARVHLTDGASGHQTEAIVSLVRGRLFCIEFSHTPRDLRGSSNLKIEIESIGNPMCDSPTQ